MNKRQKQKTAKRKSLEKKVIKDKEKLSNSADLYEISANTYTEKIIMGVSSDVPNSRDKELNYALGTIKDTSEVSTNLYDILKTFESNGIESEFESTSRLECYSSNESDIINFMDELNYLKTNAINHPPVLSTALIFDDIHSSANCDSSKRILDVVKLVDYLYDILSKSSDGWNNKELNLLKTVKSVFGIEVLRHLKNVVQHSEVISKSQLLTTIEEFFSDFEELKCDTKTPFDESETDIYCFENVESSSTEDSNDSENIIADTDSLKKMSIIDTTRLSAISAVYKFCDLLIVEYTFNKLVRDRDITEDIISLYGLLEKLPDLHTEDDKIYITEMTHIYSYEAVEHLSVIVQYSNFFNIIDLESLLEDVFESDSNMKKSILLKSKIEQFLDSIPSYGKIPFEEIYSKVFAVIRDGESSDQVTSSEYDEDLKGGTVYGSLEGIGQLVTPDTPHWTYNTDLSEEQLTVLTDALDIPANFKDSASTTVEKYSAVLMYAGENSGPAGIAFIPEGEDLTQDSKNILYTKEELEAQFRSMHMKIKENKENSTEKNIRNLKMLEKVMMYQELILFGYVLYTFFCLNRFSTFNWVVTIIFLFSEVAWFIFKKIKLQKVVFTSNLKLYRRSIQGIAWSVTLLHIAFFVMHH